MTDKVNKKKIHLICDKCGKEAPVDKQKSNHNWTVYLPDKKCSCGGIYKFNFLI